ncbi:MAG: HNH endonuclease [Pseudomonadota bacterium]
MTKLVLLHKASSIYDDRPETRYDFPLQYRKAMEQGVGDWIVYQEPAKAGPRGYFACARIAGITPHPELPRRYFAEMADFLPFDAPVPRVIDGRPLEAALTTAQGGFKKGGAVQLAVRRLPDAEFARIVELGLPDTLEEQEASRYDPERKGALPGLAEPVGSFKRPVVERLTRRPYRDVVFRRRVRQAYDYRCALSGLRLRNGGGRPEVQAAHIVPVEDGGNDTVSNGLALSGTLHCIFDRGLVSVGGDGRILISRNKVPPEVADRLIAPGVYSPARRADGSSASSLPRLAPRTPLRPIRPRQRSDTVVRT